MSAVADLAYVRPASLADALAARRAHPSWTVLCGGTDLMTGGHAAVGDGVLDVFGLPDLVGVSVVGGSVRVGAATTFAALLGAPVVDERRPLLRDAVSSVGAVQIRERGTIGGNVMTSSPVGDTLPCLLALDAVVEVASEQGVRQVPYDAFCTGYRRTGLAADELLVAVVVPLPAPGTVQRWRKVGARSAQAISKVALAAVARFGGDGRYADVRLALGAVADRPIRLHAVEPRFVGRMPGAALAEEVRAAVAAAVHPIDDVRSTADYRRAVAANLVAAFAADPR